MTQGLPLRLVGLMVAALAAMLSGWAALLVLGGQTFPLGPTRLPMAYVLTPLAALAVFQLVFGMLTGSWRGGRFWLVALPVTAILWGGGLILLLEGVITPAPLLLAEVLAHLAVAVLALVLMPDRRV